MKKNNILKKIIIVFSLFLNLNLYAMIPTFKISLLPHFIFPLGYEYEKIGIGVGVKLKVQPFEFLEIFGGADYDNLLLQSNSFISVINTSLGLGYNYKINDSFEMSLFGQAGIHHSIANKSGDMLNGPSFGGGISFTYKMSPVFSSASDVYYTQYQSKPLSVLKGVGIASGISINMNEVFANNEKIEVELVELNPVFPVLYSWYETNPFGIISIKNNEDGAIKDISISFYQEQYMSQPSVCEEIELLNKDESIEIELKAFFNDTILNLTENTDTYGSVQIEYYYLGQKKKQEIPLEILICNRNAMSWDDDRRASVFVSKKDPAVLYYAKNVLGAIRSLENSTKVPVNVQRAAAIFDSLNTFGINYVIDPSSSYSDNIGTSSIDFLQFPYQTLMFRGGDCDDLSILFCSLFEACGIETGFITIPGHIFMAFNSGVKAADIEMFTKKENVFIYDDYCWLPLEITLTGDGFVNAWKIGCSQWNRAVLDDSAAFFPTKESHLIYKPVSVPGAVLSFEMQDQALIIKDYNSLKNKLQGEFK